ncbi:indole-3-glycerol-phosphate synthase [Dehalogenimonas formicexedens]|uniref:Indole-3-glycerol phosphate synthase n=1 Tax=Dehalogenimonas formicexedens TaxID=1839801 RepID=A0A1P8F5N6_9CHLR|nr:indole-3-glycerol phosphate synthase TrpC [Dehalogenimonas formicexedens]APV43791.1 indole-3-glycerol-phosphate synthase [Dehalogenimonas formicexedens]
MLLDEIVAATKTALTERKRRIPLTEIVRQAESCPPPLDFAGALSGNTVKIIAEVKKASPSRGVIKADFEPLKIARQYAGAGAAAVSVLTEEKYFEGSPDYLKTIANELGGNRPPLLRKDFIIDPYQVYESRVLGADAILLIVAILSPSALTSLLDLARSLGMEALVESHNEPEIQTALESGAGIIGINNRDLKTFKVDLKTAARLRPFIPNDRLVVSESGISSGKDIQYLNRLGVNAALVGEALMTAPDISLKLKELAR